MGSRTQLNTKFTVYFTPNEETRALIEAASEDTDIDSFINECVRLRMHDKQQKQN